MQSQGSSLEDVHLHGGSTFLHARYVFLDVLSPAWRIRRSGEDCHERDSWKGGSPTPLSLPLPKDCTGTPELSIHVHAMYKPMHVYVYFVGVLAHVWVHICLYIYAQCVCVHTVCIRTDARMYTLVYLWARNHHLIILREEFPAREPKAEGKCPPPLPPRRRCQG